MNKLTDSKEYPKVSVIIPIYGVEDYIAECVHSLFNQTYENIEFVFVNDCTPDGSMEILYSLVDIYPNLKDRIKIINQPINRGLAAARYVGIIESSGDYVFHLDSDDWLALDAIESFVKKAIVENADMCVGNFYINYKDKEFTQRVNIAPKQNYIKEILARNRKYSWTLCNRLIKRTVQLEAMPIVNLNMGEDYATVPRLIYYSDRITHINKPQYHYRQTNTNSYTKSISKKSIEDLVLAISILNQFFNDKNHSNEYRKALEIGKMHIKYELYISGNKETRIAVNDIFPEVNYRCAISFPEKIIFTLSKYKMYNLMGCIAKIGLRIKKVLK